MALEAHGPSSFKVEIRDPKTWSTPTKTGLANNFWKIKFSPRCTVEAVNAPQTLFMDTLSPGLGLWPDKVYYCEDALKHLCNKICLKIIDWPWLQNHKGPRSFKIQITGQKTWSAHSKTGLAYKFCFIKLLTSCTVEATDSPQSLFGALLAPGLGSELSLGGLYVIRLTTGKVHYNFCLINFAWKWLIMASEAHGSQVLPELDYGPKNMILPN